MAWRLVAMGNVDPQPGRGVGNVDESSYGTQILDAGKLDKVCLTFSTRCFRIVDGCESFYTDQSAGPSLYEPDRGPAEA